jgi:hypothetical protein
MMKKFLCLILLVGLCSSASALLQISVGGDPDPVDSEIILEPSDEIYLDIWNDETLTTTNTPVTLALVVNDDAGAISGGTINADITNAAIFVFDLSAIPQPVGENLSGIWGGVTVFDGTVASGTVLVDEILFHCEGPFEALIQLIQIDDSTGVPTGTIYDSVTIHQPEPMTIALLGLGGLFLRRRK